MNKIVYFGNEQLAQGLEKPITPIFDTLLADNYNIAALVLPRQLFKKNGKSEIIPVMEIATTNNIPIIFADQEDDLDETLQKLGAEIGVLASYGKIVHQSTIDVLPRGIVNIHPSALPKYRGSTPLETVILNGDKETSVSLMALSAKMDAGPIYTQEEIILSSQESKQELYEKLANLGAEMLSDNLSQIISGELTPTAQDDTEATFTKQLSKTDGALDPKTMNATECERKIRAYYGWPRTRLTFCGQETIITRAKVLSNFAGDEWPDVICCADESYLQIVELVNPKSGKQMKTADYLRGIRV